MKTCLKSSAIACLAFALAACRPAAPTVEEAAVPAPPPVAESRDPAPARVELDAAEGVDGYVARAGALRDALAPGGDIAAQRRDATALMELGAALVPAFVEQHPHCGDYLAAALEVRSAWPSLDLDAIERDYHHDGRLPKIENSGVCYHMKDLVTHPATVLVVLKEPQPDYAKARAEIDEILEHAAFVGRSTAP